MKILGRLQRVILPGCGIHMFWMQAYKFHYNQPSAPSTCPNFQKKTNLTTNKPKLHSKHVTEEGWRSGERTRLPPMWLGFDSRTRRHMWVEFVVSSHPCSERFFSGYSGFPLSSKTNISKFQFDPESIPISALR